MHAANATTQFVLHLVAKYGYFGIAIVVGGESTGLPLPGETTVLAAAALARAGHLSPWLVWTAASIGAIVGDNIGYAVGHFGGHPLLERWGRYVWITPERLERAKQPIHRYGPWAVFFGRFLAVLRAVTALVAGASGMEWRLFLIANAAGGIFWAGLVTLAGYYGENAAVQAYALWRASPRLYTIAALALFLALLVAGTTYRIQMRRMRRAGGGGAA